MKLRGKKVRTAAKQEEKIVLETAFDRRHRPILCHIGGSLASGDATDVGMLLYEAKNENDPFFGKDGFYYFPDHPRNADAVERLRMVLYSKGYQSRIRIKGAQGEDAKDILLPKMVPTMQRPWESVFGGVSHQADDNELLLLSKELVKKYHHHLANAAIPFVLEDYQPDKLGARFGVQGEVWGFCQKLGGEFRKLTGYDFRIVLCEGVWRLLKTPVRRWLLDHELMHADRDEMGRWGIRDHDIQMFTDEAVRYPTIKEAVDKMATLVMARFQNEEDSKVEEDTNEEDLVDDSDDEEEIVNPRVTIPSDKPPTTLTGKKPKGASRETLRAMKAHADSKVGMTVVPIGLLAKIKSVQGE